MVQQAAACAAPSPKARGREPRSGKEARPIVGGLVRVRGREAVVLAVRPWLAPPQPGSSLVSIEYTDRQEPGGDSLLWELEQNRSAAGNDLPDVALKAPMAPIPFRSMVRAAIWTSPGIGGPQPPAGQAGPGAAALLSLAACAVEAKGYQLVPVSKALEMPRVRLLLADDVGLGKTIEAGFIMAELLIRRRIRKILVLCPPSLCRQWQRELAGKFGLDFRVMDRRLACEVRGRLGPETSPWECFDALIASYHYLAQPAILEEFRRGCHAGGRPHLPWDLLVVDEAHNLMPRPAGRESRLTATLKAISPWFEHRVFLTATPHDGFTSSFTGLLEILEPLSFRRSCAPTPEETARFSRTIVRHTRREIERGSLPGRRLVALEVSFSPLERELLAAFKSFQSTIRRWGKVSHSGRGTAAAFVLEVLGKRLLSSTVAFALSFASFRQGLAGGLNPDEQVLDSLAWAMRSRLPAGREQEGAWLEAARVIGAWLNRYFPSAGAKVERIVRALLRLGLDPAAGTGPVPVEDSRFERLLAWMGEHLLSKGRWLADERVILFTEYVATLDYLAARLKARFPGDAERFAAMSGSMREAERRRLVERFNDPTCPLRVLLTTDVAAEGLNLQSCCRYVFHQDIPWNPSVLEQRVGRVHRTGQTREVRAFHFTSGEAEEFRFLSRVADKVERIRGDLGQTADVLAASVQAVLAKGERSRPLLPAGTGPSTD
jgi:superfamily II DNA or RNA helicase